MLHFPFMGECLNCGYADWAVFDDHAICANCSDYYCFIVPEDLSFGNLPIYGDKEDG